MPTTCCVRDCNSTKNDSSLLFYSLPNEPKRREKWIKAIKQSSKENPWSLVLSERSFICSLHFVTGKKNDDKSHVDYVPSVFHSDEEISTSTIMDTNLNTPQRKRGRPSKTKEALNTPAKHHSSLLKCKSCNKLCADAVALFEHIQEKCYNWYKNHPENWSSVFSVMIEEHESDSMLGSHYTVIKPKIKNTEGSKSKVCNMSVDEYFYAQRNGHNRFNRKMFDKKFNCYSCDKWLTTNTRFMSHTKHKILKCWERIDVEQNTNTCAHCYRRFDTPFQRQCHIEMVHSAIPSANTCKICELYFNSTKLFLEHMKTTHNRNEMPFVCHICKFASSFYEDVTNHFKEVHAGTGSLQCCFCLQVRNTAKNFLTHNISHIKKNVRCDLCRLQFHTDIEMKTHCKNDHLPNLNVPGAGFMKNKDLSDYEVRICIKKSDEENDLDEVEDPEYIEIEESMGSGIPTQLNSFSFSLELENIRMNKDLYKGSYECWECKNVIGNKEDDFKSHFGTVYKCKMCSYLTCCKLASDDHILKTHIKEELDPSFTEATPRKNLEVPLSPAEELLPVKNEEPVNNTNIFTQITKESDTELSPQKDQKLMLKEAAIASPKKSDKQPLVGIKRKSIGVESSKPKKNGKKIGIKIKPLKKTSKEKEGRAKRHKKALASDYYFPDIEEDDKWDKLFKEENKKLTPRKKYESYKQVKHYTVPQKSKNIKKTQSATSTYRIVDEFTIPNELNGTNFVLVRNSKLKQLYLKPKPNMKIDKQFTPVYSKDVPKAPLSLQFVEVKSTSLVARWTHPMDCSITQYKILFQGIKAPTSKLLPPNHTMARLVDLIPDTDYIVRVFTVYKNLESDYVEARCHTAQLEEPDPTSKDVKMSNSNVPTETIDLTIDKKDENIPEPINNTEKYNAETPMEAENQQIKFKDDQETLENAEDVANGNDENKVATENTSNSEPAQFNNSSQNNEMTLIQNNNDIMETENVSIENDSAAVVNNSSFSAESPQNTVINNVSMVADEKIFTPESSEILQPVTTSNDDADLILEPIEDGTVAEQINSASSSVEQEIKKPIYTEEIYQSNEVDSLNLDAKLENILSQEGIDVQNTQGLADNQNLKIVDRQASDSTTDLVNLQCGDISSSAGDAAILDLQDIV